MRFEELKDSFYLGDGVYVGHDGFQLWLVTHDGRDTTNAIAVEPHLIETLLQYVARLQSKNAGGDV